MARKTIAGLMAEAKEYGVVVAKEGDYLRLKVAGGTVAWLVQTETAWLAQTARPEITGTWTDTKVGCLDWALGHAIEEFCGK